MALCFSIVGLLLWIIPAQILKLYGIDGPGIGGVLMKIPGTKYVTGTYADDGVPGGATVQMTFSNLDAMKEEHFYQEEMPPAKV